jgi:hypothetical protein
MVTIPVERNKILLRVENLADSGANALVYLDRIATILAQSANKNNLPASLNHSIVETTLTANMDLKEMLDRKLKWKTMDDVSEKMESKKMEPYADTQDDTPIELKPQ